MVNCLCVSTCGKAFASNRNLCSHQKRCHTCRHMVKYRCGKCSKMFSTPHLLNRHQVVHSDVRKFRCHICDKSFKYKPDCTRHVRSHSGVQDYQCHICGRRFNRKYHCNRHVDGHFGIKNFKCTVCDKGFAEYSTARCHEDNCCRNGVSVSDSSDSDGVSSNERIDVNGDMEDTDWSLPSFCHQPSHTCHIQNGELFNACYRKYQNFINIHRYAFISHSYPDSGIHLYAAS